tara:strand:+ start:1726 stop:2193 length:468 start_codon:yes stop_codon:yes gene_type:complete
MTYIPQKPHRYIGNQIVLNSSRLIFNAKKDSILLYSNKAIGFSTNGSFHFDTDNSEESESKFIVNSPNIYLGLEFNNTLPEQPAVLGNELIEILEDICDAILNVYSDIVFQISVVPDAPEAINQKNISILNDRAEDLQILKDNLESIKSEKTKLV